MNKENRELVEFYERLANYNEENELDLEDVTMDEEKENYLDPDKIIILGTIEADKFQVITDKNKPLEVSIEIYGDNEVLCIRNLNEDFESVVVERAMKRSKENEEDITIYYKSLVRQIQKSYETSTIGNGSNVIRVIERSHAGNNNVEVILGKYSNELNDIRKLKTFNFKGTIENNYEVVKCVCHYINMGYILDDYLYPHNLVTQLVSAAKYYLKDRSTVLSLSGVAKVAGVSVDTFKGWYNRNAAMSIEKVAKLIDVVSQI